MARETSQPPSGKPPPSRRERLAEALRANLRRRKTQRRARAASEGKDAPSPREEAERP